MKNKMPATEAGILFWLGMEKHAPAGEFGFRALRRLRKRISFGSIAGESQRPARRSCLSVVGDHRSVDQTCPGESRELSKAHKRYLPAGRCFVGFLIFRGTKLFKGLGLFRKSLLNRKMNYLCKIELSANEKKLLRRYFVNRPIRRAYVFGSYACKTAVRKKSDLDILVELDYSQSIGMKFFGYQIELEELLKKKVDLVSAEGLSKHVRPFIDKEKVLIYEKTSVLNKQF